MAEIRARYDSQSRLCCLTSGLAASSSLSLRASINLGLIADAVYLYLLPSSMPPLTSSAVNATTPPLCIGWRVIRMLVILLTRAVLCVAPQTKMPWRRDCLS